VRISHLKLKIGEILDSRRSIFWVEMPAWLKFKMERNSLLQHLNPRDTDAGQDQTEHRLCKRLFLLLLQQGLQTCHHSRTPSL